MKRIDLYVDSLYKHLDESSDEVQAFKQEMKNHLLQTVEELKNEGKTEEESIEIALNRFGEKDEVESQLINVLKIQKKFGKALLITALVFLGLAIISFMTVYITNKQFIKRFNIVCNDIRKIKDTAKNGSIDSLDRVVKEVFSKVENQVSYVALVHLPDDFDRKTYSGRPVLLGKMEYLYPHNFKDAMDVIGYDSGGELFNAANDKMYIETGFKKGANGNYYEIFNVIGFGLMLVYWVLFGIWATIKCYHNKSLNIAWFILFFALNVLGYLLFLSQKKEDSLNCKLPDID